MSAPEVQLTALRDGELPAAGTAVGKVIHPVGNTYRAVVVKGDPDVSAVRAGNVDGAGIVVNPPPPPKSGCKSPLTTETVAPVDY